MASLKEKRAVARRLASEGVGSGVSKGIGLRLYDAPAETTAREIVNESLAHEIARKLDGLDGQFRSAKMSDPSADFTWRWVAHGIKVTARFGCSRLLVLSQPRGDPAMARTCKHLREVNDVSPTADGGEAC